MPIHSSGDTLNSRPSFKAISALTLRWPRQIWLIGNGTSGPRHVLGEALKVPGVAGDEFVGPRLFGHQSVPILAGPHARLSRSSATAFPIASGSSLYPLGTSKNIPPSRSISLASIRLGLRLAITGTSLIEPSESSSYAKTCPGCACGSLTLWRSSTVNVFVRGNSHWKTSGSSFFSQILTHLGNPWRAHYDDSGHGATPCRC
jgi:hypothetical protein